MVNASSDESQVVMAAQADVRLSLPKIYGRAGAEVQRKPEGADAGARMPPRWRKFAGSAAGKLLRATFFGVVLALLLSSQDIVAFGPWKLGYDWRCNMEVTLWGNITQRGTVLNASARVALNVLHRHNAAAVIRRPCCGARDAMVNASSDESQVVMAAFS